MTGKQKGIIGDNLRAFIKNFGAVRIEENNGFYVYLPSDSESYIQYCYNIHYLSGWLYGAVQAANRSEFRKESK